MASLKRFKETTFPAFQRFPVIFDILSFTGFLDCPKRDYLRYFGVCVTLSWWKCVLEKWVILWPIFSNRIFFCSFRAISLSLVHDLMFLLEIYFFLLNYLFPPVGILLIPLFLFVEQLFNNVLIFQFLWFVV